MANILKLEGRIGNSEVLPAPNPRFYSEMQDHLDAQQQIKYELIAARISNELNIPGPDVNFSLAGKVDYVQEQEGTKFLKVNFKKKGQKETGKGQGFASLTPATFMDKINTTIKQNHSILSQYPDYTLFSTDEADKTKLELLPFMGIYLNHDFIFSDVFKFQNANLQAFDSGSSPKGFEKLVEPENINAESSREAEEIDFFLPYFYGFRNFSPKPITLVAQQPLDSHRISRISTSAEIKNSIYQERPFDAFLDEIVYLAIDFFIPLPEFQVVTKTSSFNTFSSMFPAFLANSIIESLRQIISTGSPPLQANIKIEWVRGWLTITGSLDAPNTKIHLAGNDNLLTILGFDTSQLATIRIAEQKELFYYFPSTGVSALNSDTLLTSNGAIQEGCQANIFPLYIMLPLNSSKSNMLFSNPEKEEMLALGMLHDYSNFTPLIISIPISHQLFVGLRNGKEKPLHFTLPLTIYLKCNLEQ